MARWPFPILFAVDIALLVYWVFTFIGLISLYLTTVSFPTVDCISELLTSCRSSRNFVVVLYFFDLLRRVAMHRKGFVIME